MLKKPLLTFIIIMMVVLSWAQVPNKAALSAEGLHRAEKALTRVIVHDIFSPPVASRIYLYANMAAYEAMVPSQSAYQPLSKKLAGFPVITFDKSKPVDYSLCALYAFMKAGQRFVFSEAMLQDSLDNQLAGYKKLAPQVYKNSVDYAQAIVDSIAKWSAGDHYKETRKIRRYSISREDGKWLPTPPGYLAAVEPYWYQMRAIALDSAGACKPVPALPFSKGKESEFYRQAYEVYFTGKNLTVEQRNIALFWDCNPFFLNTQGHLNFATKKLSPGGHWISITGIAARIKKLNLMEAAYTYLMTSIALYDGFISCWEEKYRSNLIRPETYINSVVDEGWRPLLQTPPFPEYTSGHSVISTAAAVVLTKILGDRFAFDDNTETPYGLPVRQFTSFNHAAEEAAISRLYGGIHYRAAIRNGQAQGQKVGELVLKKIGLTDR